MPTYTYRAVHSSGRIAKGVAAAANESELAQFLGSRRMELIEAREKKERPARPVSWQPGWRRVPPRALTLFCSQVADLLQAGMNLLDILTDLAAETQSFGPVLSAALADITRSLSHGSRIADAFARHPRVFPAVFIAILSAGEASGDMARAFGQLTLYAESRARINERIRRALRYPLFLLAVALSVVSFMMAMVVPQIVGFLQSIDSQLPPATRVLIAVSNAFVVAGWMAAPALLGGVALAGAARRTSARAALFLDRAALRLPLVGAVMQKLMLARFAQSFSILVQSGVGIPAGMQGARGTLGNRALEARLDEASRRIATGSALSLAMDELFAPFALRVLRSGEQGGRVEKSLADIAAHYDREAADSAERMIGALEPGLTLLIGGILAWVVLAVLGPIYGSLSTMNMMG